MNIFLGELLGTMFLIILGDGVVANVLLNKNKGQGGGGGGAWIMITAGWAFAVLIGVNVAQAFGSGAAAINPAVSIAFGIIGVTPWSEVPIHIIAQMIGAFLGGVIVWLAYLPHWAETSDAGLKLAVFSTGPAIRNTGTNVICEIIGTMVLVLGVAALFRLNTPVVFDAAAGVPSGLGPYLVAALVWGIGLSLGGPTGYAINPARDLGPRVAHLVLPIPGKGDSDWEYSWIPVVGPIIGGILAGIVLLIL